MARTHNPFAQVERSKVQTPWGEYQIAPPNKARLQRIAALQEVAMQLDDTDHEAAVRTAIGTAAAGLERGEELEAKLLEQWDAGELTVPQVRSLAEFVAEEISGEVDAGND